MTNKLTHWIRLILLMKNLQKVSGDSEMGIFDGWIFFLVLPKSSPMHRNKSFWLCEDDAMEFWMLFFAAILMVFVTLFLASMNASLCSSSPVFLHFFSAFLFSVLSFWTETGYHGAYGRMVRDQCFQGARINWWKSYLLFVSSSCAKRIPVGL